MTKPECRLAAACVFWYLKSNGTLGPITEVIRSLIVTAGIEGSDYHVNLVVQRLRQDYDPKFGLDGA